MKRHPLFDEAKSEVVIAFEEVRRVERKIMALEEDFDLEVDAMTARDGPPSDAAFRDVMREKEDRQERLDVDGAYAMRARAATRFSLIAAAFAVAESFEDPRMARDVLRWRFFRPEDVRPRKLALDKQLLAFANGLRAYRERGGCAEADAEVRGAWRAIETALQEAGGVDCL